MDGRGMPGWLRALGILAVVLLIGGIGYAIGLGAGAAGVPVVAGAPVVYAGHGFGLFGLLVPILLIVLLLAAFSGRRGGGHWRRGYGPGGWYGSGDGRDVPPPFEPMLESWHRRAHGDSEPTLPPKA
ncbi:MAG: hypothetical protein H0W07_04060 [Chloroflexi bacterium]|nr:hypothetical protein [Chloroflexota bacterium]